MATYVPTIGLEIHAELKTRSKMFCSCKNNAFEQTPNVNICPVCMGHPGTLPVPNEQAIHQAIKAGLALDCSIAQYSKFDRKNYFYPDLPKGYQISQYDLPLCEKGVLKVGDRNIRITRIHLEEDAGRSQHPKGADYSLVDFNRAGIPLMELVTEPEIESAREAGDFARQLQLILRYLDASDADMEKGQMRVEANVSIRPKGAEELGTKVEIKNLNSFRSVESAIEYEITRQTELLESGEQVTQETRGWNEKKQETFAQREKEEAHDYRYFPEPDIPPLRFTEATVEKVRAEIPELPRARQDRLQQEYALTGKQADMLVRNKDLGEYFEHVASELTSSLSGEALQKATRLAVNYISCDLQGLLQGKSPQSKDFKITGENFAELISLIVAEKVSSPLAKTLLKQMFETGADPSQLLDAEGLARVSGEGEIEKIAREIVEQNPKAAEDYKKGKENSLQFLVGQMMVQTRGTVNPKTAREVLQKSLQ